MQDEIQTAVAAIMRAEDARLSDCGSQCNGVSLTQLHAAANNFSFAFAAWEGEEAQQECATAFARSLCEEDRAALIFSLLTEQAASEQSLSLADKQLALRVANTMGPDWAQWLYHFAVFVTKAA